MRRLTGFSIVPYKMSMSKFYVDRQ